MAAGVAATGAVGAAAGAATGAAGVAGLAVTADGTTAWTALVAAWEVACVTAVVTEDVADCTGAVTVCAKETAEAAIMAAAKRVFLNMIFQLKEAKVPHSINVIEGRVVDGGQGKSNHVYVRCACRPTKWVQLGAPEQHR